MDVAIDFDRLQQLIDRLQASIDELEGTDRFTEEVAAATGHIQLSGTVGDFGRSWDGAREDLVEQMRTARDHVQALFDTFTELDLRLEAGLEVDIPAAIDSLESRYEAMGDDPR